MNRNDWIVNLNRQTASRIPNTRDTPNAQTAPCQGGNKGKNDKHGVIH